MQKNLDKNSSFNSFLGMFPHLEQQSEGKSNFSAVKLFSNYLQPLNYLQGKRTAINRLDSHPKTLKTK